MGNVIESITAVHGGGMGLMRLWLQEKAKGFPDLSHLDEIVVSTSGRWVCTFCVNSDGSSGLGAIAKALGIKKMKVRADLDPAGGRAFASDGLLGAVEVLFENGILK